MWEELAKYLTEHAAEVDWDRNLAFARPNTGASEGRRNHFIDYSSPHHAKVWQLIENLPEYAPYLGSSARIAPGNGFGRPARELASWLIAQSKIRDLDSVLGDFRVFLSNNRAELTELVALWGTNPSSQIDIGYGIRLTSINDIPLSYYRDQFSGVQQYIVSEALHQRRMGTAVLERNVILDPILYRGTKSPYVAELFPPLDDVARCLTVFFQRSVCVLGHWHQADIKLPLVGRDSGCGATAYEHCFGFPAPKQVVDEEALRLFVQNYLTFEHMQRQRLDLAIDRLSIAYRTTDMRNKSIELGTVLEVLLWQDGDPNDNLSFRIRQRGCILLGGSTDERRETHGMLGKVYGLRSKAVHGDILFDETRDLGKIVDEGLRIWRV